MENTTSEISTKYMQNASMNNWKKKERIEIM
jgi:hypothetical protein